MTLDEARAHMFMKAKAPMEFTKAERVALHQLADRRLTERWGGGYPVTHMWSDTAIGLRRLYKRGLVNVFPAERVDGNEDAEGQPVVRPTDPAAGCQAARMCAEVFGARDAAALLDDWTGWLASPVLSRDVPQMALVAALHWHYADRDRAYDYVDSIEAAEPRVVRVDIKPAHLAVRLPDHADGRQGGYLNQERGAVVAEHLSDGTIHARRVEAPDERASRDALAVTPRFGHWADRAWGEPDHYAEPAYAAVVLGLMEATAPDLFDPWLPISVDLRTWTVRVGADTRPSAQSVPFASTVPMALKAALDTLEAPVFANADEFVAWAEENLTAPSVCGGTMTRRPGDTMGWYKPKRSGTKRHVVHFDPHTLEWQTVEAASHDVDAHHRKFEERYPDAGDRWGCAHTARAVRVVAPADELWRTGRYTQSAAEHLAAIRCITRAVQFLDRGLDLHESAYLLPVGISGDQAAVVHAAVAAGTVTQSHALTALDGRGLEFVGLRATVDNADILVSRLLDPSHDADSDIFGARLHEMLDAISQVGQSVIGKRPGIDPAPRGR